MPTRRPLTIGIDARAAAEVPAGRGRVIRELLRTLAARDDPHRYVLYAREVWPDVAFDERFAWRLITASDGAWHLRAARDANRVCDVFLAANSYLTILFLRIPTVTIVYDLVAFEPDMHANRRSTVTERMTLGPAVRRSAALLAISQTTADALLARFPGCRARTLVAHPGVTAEDAELTPEQAEALPPPGFVLAVGTLEPRKNLPRLVAAYSSLSETTQARHPLVVVGALGWETGPTLSALRSLGDRCQMLGYVPDPALAELYRRCTVFCYPSLGEGFGLPVLEAMAAGAPVLTSDVSSLPEVGGDAVDYANPRNVASIAAGLQRILDDEPHRTDLIARAQVRAGEFSWEHFAATTLDTLESSFGSTTAQTAVEAEIG